MSAFHGKIEEIPGISVDNFEKCENRAYFLSHCHFDHTYGLYENEFLTYLIKKRYYVYASTHTVKIIAHRKPALERFMRPLKLGPRMVTVPGDKERAIDEKYIKVTLIPAGHCFGSVMFLFETDKTVLFTGDFRIMEDDLWKFKYLHKENGDVINIDTLYVDTEFQSSEYADFPKRSECVGYALIEIKKWLRKSERRRVALHVSAEYGYEYIFNAIYKKLGVKVYVNETAWEFYSQVQNLVPGVTNDVNARIHLCSNRGESETHDHCIRTEKEDTLVHCFGDHNSKHTSLKGTIAPKRPAPDSPGCVIDLTAYKKPFIELTTSKDICVNNSSKENLSAAEINENSMDTSTKDNVEEICCIDLTLDESPTKDAKPSPSKDLVQKKEYLFMHFSARKWKNYVEGNKMLSADYKMDRMDVCFATHCSRNELIYFVNYLAPKKVVGFRDPYLGPVNAKICY